MKRIQPRRRSGNAPECQCVLTALFRDNVSRGLQFRGLNVTAPGHTCVAGMTFCAGCAGWLGHGTHRRVTRVGGHGEPKREESAGGAEAPVAPWR